MVTLERKGDRVDVGAQFYYSNCPHVVGMVERVGLAASQRRIKGKVQYRLRNGSTYLYEPGVPYMKLLGLRGNLELYRFILRYVVFGRRFPHWGIARDIPAYDNVGILDLYPSASDRPMRDYLISPVTTGKTGGLPEWASLYHYLRMFRSTMFAHCACRFPGR